MIKGTMIVIIVVHLGFPRNRSSHVIGHTCNGFSSSALLLLLAHLLTLTSPVSQLFPFPGPLGDDPVTASAVGVPAGAIFGACCSYDVAVSNLNVGSVCT